MSEFYDLIRNAGLDQGWGQYTHLETRMWDSVDAPSLAYRAITQMSNTPQASPDNRREKLILLTQTK